VNALGIETATETVGVAVRTAEGVEAELALTGRRRHVETLTPAVDHLLAQVGLTPGDLEVVAVDIGPGLFTGLRVGVAAAKGLAQALGIGLVGVTSLDVLTAAAAAATGAVDGAADAARRGLVLAAVDARRGELFAVLRQIGPEGSAHDVLGPYLVTPSALADDLERLNGLGQTLGQASGQAQAQARVRAVHAVGDGALRYRDVLGAVPGVVVADLPAFPPPATLLHLALRRLDSGESPVEPGSVAPLYMREADARVNFERAKLA
jgi:tRNA threonylcarbamoyladenosine biosynthesis protein TsaB